MAKVSYTVALEHSDKKLVETKSSDHMQINSTVNNTLKLSMDPAPESGFRSEPNAASIAP